MTADEKIEWVEIDKLVPNPRNPNGHSEEQIKRLADIIRYQGWRHPILVSTRTGFIVAGHGRLLAAKHLKLQKVPVQYQSFIDEDQEKAFLVSDNAIASWAELDLSAVNAFIPDLSPEFNIDLFGIKDFVIEPAEKYGDPDECPDPVPTSNTHRGELFQLGQHRLLCGDATNKSDVERLMGGEKADMVFTDPPYGIGYEYNTHNDFSNHHNAELVDKALHTQECGKVWTPGLNNLARDISRFGKTKVAVWYKKFAMAGSGIGGASTWEPILIMNPTKKELANDVIEVMTDREELNGQSLRELHSCPKPVALFETLLTSLSNAQERIYEPFCGSGTTLIACEKTNRRCFGMEIDPLYVDVAVTRWEKYTGKKAVKL